MYGHLIVGHSLRPRSVLKHEEQKLAYDEDGGTSAKQARKLTPWQIHVVVKGLRTMLV